MYQKLDEWIKKMWSICIQRNSILPCVTTWMDIDRIMLNEINQEEKGNLTPVEYKRHLHLKHSKEHTK